MECKNEEILDLDDLGVEFNNLFKELNVNEASINYSGSNRWRSNRNRSVSSNWRQESAETSQATPTASLFKKEKYSRNQAYGWSMSSAKYDSSYRGKQFSKSSRGFIRTAHHTIDREQSSTRWDGKSYRSNDPDCGWRPRQTPKCSIDIDELIELEHGEPESIINKLADDNTCLEILQLCSESGNVLVLFLRVLNKLHQSGFNETNNRIVKLIADNNFLEEVKAYLSIVVAEDQGRNAFFWKDPNQFWNNLLSYYNDVFDFMPNTAYEILPKVIKATVMCIHNVKEFHNDALYTGTREIENIKKIHDEVMEKTHDEEKQEVNIVKETIDETVSIEKEEVDNVNIKEKPQMVNVKECDDDSASTCIKKELETFLQRIICINERKKNGVDEEPPNNFRDIDVYPSTEEVTQPEIPFIRPIIKDGAYESVEHYLDVQFRLLREDFIASLRSGICTYLTDKTSYAKSVQQFDVRIYEKVRFTGLDITQGRVAQVVRYTTKVDHKRIQESTKQFIYGSLVCFTWNQFETLMFGTVVDNNIKFLSKGEIIVDIRDGQVLYNRDCIMVESTVFFEPYYRVLRALQHMQETDFPFKEYIVDVTPNTKPPKYLKSGKVVELVYDNRCYRFDILSPHTWPRADQVGLNASQFEAFNAAVSREFSIIQGPPGTGKTHTAHRIVQFLLENSHVLNYQGPILVVCFTNHALDQFLEGILSHTHLLCRVGGQSKNPAMEKYNLSRFKDILRKIRQKYRLKELRESKKNYYIYYYENCEYNSDDLEYCDGDDEYDFSDYFRSAHYQSFRFGRSKEYFNYKNAMESLHQVIKDIKTNKGIINIRKCESYVRSLKHGNLKLPIHGFQNWLLEGHNEFQCEQEKMIKPVVDKEMSGNDMTDIFTKQEENARRLNDDTYFIEEIENETINFSITLDDYEKKIRSCEKEIVKLQFEQSEKNNQRIEHVTRCLKTFKSEYRYLKWRLRQFETSDDVTTPDIDENSNLNELLPNERWDLYRHWLNEIRGNILRKISLLDPDFRKLHQEYEEISQLANLYIMRKMRVIGMTTTGAAKHHALLKTLQCPIVLVEEAAEVLESHVVASLTKNCQQVILIGDHKQLRPSTSQYNLAKKYNLEISLFERMVQNGIHCQQLNVQHRMRPEISSLIVPSIYSHLENAESVYKYPPVLGVTKSLYFITHSCYEDYVANSSSHKNEYEAKYLIELAVYLLRQGYTSDEVTILATYKGQMYCLDQLRRFYPELKNVRITVVDNFQGEESKIILLSLVRSNDEANIGFLKTENRVCVALSRAKEGFFVIGNMSNLEKSSTIWPQIKEALIRVDSIGLNLTLQCQVHSMQTIIRSLQDFEKVPNGGCDSPCATTMKCGHVCKLKCHPYDREHEKIICKEKCIRTCQNGHPCAELCYKECDEHCKIPVKTLLTCGHTHNIPCYKQIQNYLCQSLKEANLPCGHTAQIMCYQQPDEAKCPVICDKPLTCGHTCSQECHVEEDPDHLLYKCKEPCKKSKKNCSTTTHPCPLLCHEDCPPCEELIKKKRTVCTHVFKTECNANVDAFTCKNKCRKVLPCEHYCPKKCFEPCGDCQVMVVKSLEGCGHSIKIKCCIEPDGKLCMENCSKELKCGHSCTKKCNEPCLETCSEATCKETNVEEAEGSSQLFVE